jgi:hypothetical protein
MNNAAVLGAAFVHGKVCGGGVARAMRLGCEGGGERGISKFWPSSAEVAIQAYVMHFTTHIKCNTTSAMGEISSCIRVEL